MSALTISLLKARKSRKRRRWQTAFAEIADRLVAAYGEPSLGNYDNPVREIFFIVLSAKTTDSQYRRTDAALTVRFPTLQQIANASVEDIAACIEGGGLANKKASQLRRIAGRLLDLGEDPECRLRDMSAGEAFAFLTGLPGVGPKSALCIMMCSLKFDVFPVDVNVSRVAARLGAVARGLKHYQYQKLLPPLIPEGRSKELHVALVVHGRTMCLPRKPKCQDCRIADLCQQGRSGAGSGRGEVDETNDQESAQAESN